MLIYLDRNEMKRFGREYNKAKIYKFFQRYKKSIEIYTNMIKTLSEIDRVNQVDISLMNNNILENGLNKMAYQIKKDSFIMLLWLDLFHLHIRDRNRIEIKNCGIALINLTKEFGYTNLPNHFKRSMNRIFKKCKVKELLSAYENLTLTELKD